MDVWYHPAKFTRANILIFYRVSIECNGPLFWYLTLDTSVLLYELIDLVGGNRAEHRFIDCFLLISQSIFLSLLPGIVYVRVCA